MQNKPNLCVFWAVSGDCEEKQTQTNPIQTQNKANFDLSAPYQSQNKPNFEPKQTQFLYHRIRELFIMRPKYKELLK